MDVQQSPLTAILLCFLLDQIYGIDETFYLRPSSGTALDKCVLDGMTSTQQSDLFQCYKQCLNEPCCRAFGMRNEKCEWSTKVTEELDFIWQVNSSLSVKYNPIWLLPISYCTAFLKASINLYFTTSLMDRYISTVVINFVTNHTSSVAVWDFILFFFYKTISE